MLKVKCALRLRKESLVGPSNDCFCGGELTVTYLVKKILLVRMKRLAANSSL